MSSSPRHNALLALALGLLTTTSHALPGLTATVDLSTTNLLSSLGPAPATDPRWTTWTAPGPNDVRSPCPGLNTLANHNFINHSGRNLTIPGLLTGLAAGMNIGADFTIAIGAVGLLSAPDPFAGSFDLDWLDQHNWPIEHDASLSRGDAYFGNDHSFNSSIWKQTLAQYGASSTTGIKPAALAIANRTRDSEARNPTFTYSFREFVLRYGETALFLQAMGSNDQDGVTQLSYVRMLFEQERLPWALGWRPRAEPVTLFSLGEMIFEIFGENPDRSAEGQTITSQSYKDVLEVEVGGSEILGNLTKGLSTAVGL